MSLVDPALFESFMRTRGRHRSAFIERSERFYHAAEHFGSGVQERIHSLQGWLIGKPGAVGT